MSPNVFMVRATCPLPWATAPGAVQSCGVSLTTGGGHNQSPVCAKADEVDAEVEVVVEEVKLRGLMAAAMVEDGLVNMHNKW